MDNPRVGFELQFDLKRPTGAEKDGEKRSHSHPLRFYPSARMDNPRVEFELQFDLKRA